MDNITLGEWKSGKRADGTRWLSLGDPAKGPHYQGDLVCSDGDAALIVSSRELLNAVKWSVNHPGECLGDYPELLEVAEILIAKAASNG